MFSGECREFMANRQLKLAREAADSFKNFIGIAKLRSPVQHHGAFTIARIVPPRAGNDGSVRQHTGVAGIAAHRAQLHLPFLPDDPTRERNVLSLATGVPESL